MSRGTFHPKGRLSRLLPWLHDVPPFRRGAVHYRRLRDGLQVGIGVLQVIAAAMVGRVDQIWVGDSHAALLNDGRWPCRPLRPVGGARYVWHIGPRLMYSISRQGVPPAVLRLARVLGRLPQGRRIPWFFAFGEIDVRCHLVPLAREREDAFAFVRDYVTRVVHVANIARASHSIIVVPPPPSAATPEVIGFPVVGEVSDRLAVHRRLRRQLVEVAQSSPSGSRISILDPTDALSDETGLLRAELTFDGCHTNAHGRAIVRTEVERVLLARASQGPRGAMASSDRG